MVMGVLNMTPDSFSDGGLHNEPEKGLARVKQMRREGADIIDIGAESTRPGSLPISSDQELDRLLPTLRQLPKDQFLISVDSSKLEVQAAVIQEGVHIINDIMGGSEELFCLAEKYQCGVVSMHTSAPPENMQKHTDYKDVVEEVLQYLEGRHSLLKRYDLPRYWVDPGIGFGKTPEQSLRLMQCIDRFCGPGWGVLVGASRKSWIGSTFNVKLTDRLGASLAAAILCTMRGAEICRVHDVQETTQALAAARLLN